MRTEMVGVDRGVGGPKKGKATVFCGNHQESKKKKTQKGGLA